MKIAVSYATNLYTQSASPKKYPSLQSDPCFVLALRQLWNLSHMTSLSGNMASDKQPVESLFRFVQMSRMADTNFSCLRLTSIIVSLNLFFMQTFDYLYELTKFFLFLAPGDYWNLSGLTRDDNVVKIAQKIMSFHVLGVMCSHSS